MQVGACPPLTRTRGALRIQLDLSVRGGRDEGGERGAREVEGGARDVLGVADGDDVGVAAHSMHEPPWSPL